MGHSWAGTSNNVFLNSSWKKGKKNRFGGIMQVEVISPSWDRSGVCIIRKVHGGLFFFFHVQERSTVKRHLSGEAFRGQKLRMNRLRSKILTICFVLTSKQESK